ncbi:MAG: 50S ribosomal protein L6 [Planctomycetes bacterium]|nr:50S ribosomal protein L6 [Planctomycetota bacterium]
MSRIGKKPVSVPSGVKAEVSGQAVKFSGPKGNLAWTAPEPIRMKLEGAAIVVTRPDDLPQTRALHGTTRALLQNMVVGVKDGYSIPLEIYGTGYTCKLDGRKLLLNVGFMGRGVGKPAQFVVDIPAGVDVKVEVPAARGNNEPAKFTVSGVDKQAVGDFAASVRKIRKPEPYQGKGIRYGGEYVRRKAGKVFAGGGAG